MYCSNAYQRDLKRFSFELSTEETDFYRGRDSLAIRLQRNPKYSEVRNSLQFMGKKMCDRVFLGIIEKQINILSNGTMVLPDEELNSIIVPWDLDDDMVLQFSNFLLEIKEQSLEKRLKPYIRNFIEKDFGIKIDCYEHLSITDALEVAPAQRRLFEIELFHTIYGRLPNELECVKLIKCSYREFKKELCSFILANYCDYSIPKLLKVTNDGFSKLEESINETDYSIVDKTLIECNYLEKCYEEQFTKILYKLGLYTYVDTSPIYNTGHWWLSEDFFDAQKTIDTLNEDRDKYLGEFDMGKYEFEEAIQTVKVKIHYDGRKYFYNELVTWMLIKQEQYMFDYRCKSIEPKKLCEYWGIDRQKYDEIITLWKSFK